MNECYIDLFTLSVKCSYYNSGFSNDLKITPAKSVKTVLNRYPLSFLKMTNCYKLVWLTRDVNEVKKHFNSIFKDFIFELDMFVDNKNIYNFCKLDVNKVYLFKNEPSCFELKESGDIKLKISDVFDGKLFGKIFINLGEINCDKKNDFFINLPIIKSFWVVNIDNIDKNSCKFNINGNLVKFKKFEDNKNTLISESSFDLHEHGFYNFNIEYNDKKGEKCTKVIPPLVYDKIIGSKYISNCTINN